MLETVRNAWQFWVPILLFGVAVYASLHVIMRKRDVRAAIGWVGLIWLVPGMGAVLYGFLGVNRVRRRALEMHRERRRIVSETAEYVVPRGERNVAHPSLEGLARLSERVSGRPLLAGNRFEPLINGDEAYPAMIRAINEARASVALCTYIFGVDRAGSQFVDALAAAVKRGVDVRVLIDGAGSWYTHPRAHRALQKAGVTAARFQPTIGESGLAFFHLRNHRKILIADGAVAFTGGMNIHEFNLHSVPQRWTARDVQFRVEGPIVRQMQDTFAEDWAFVTGEVLDGPRWYPSLSPRGPSAARVITDGPEGDIEIGHSLLLGALASARESARIVTPYFLPDTSTIDALRVAALRGVKVDIVLPSRGNILPAQWAQSAQLWQVLEPGCRVYFSPPPFDHAKLFVVDKAWAFFGSTNWDARSLQLNFELDIECHDPAFATRIDAIIDARVSASTRFTLAHAEARPYWARVRDGVARLFSPYL